MIFHTPITARRIAPGLEWRTTSPIHIINLCHPVERISVNSQPRSCPKHFDMKSLPSASDRLAPLSWEFGHGSRFQDEHVGIYVRQPSAADFIVVTLSHTL